MSLLREYIRELLIEEDGVLPKGQWVLLQPGDERREVIKDQLFGLVQTTYADIGGHFKITDPGSLDRYNYWIVNDLDEDPDADVVDRAALGCDRHVEQERHRGGTRAEI